MNKSNNSDTANLLQTIGRNKMSSSESTKDNITSNLEESRLNGIITHDLKNQIPSIIMKIMKIRPHLSDLQNNDLLNPALEELNRIDDSINFWVSRYKNKSIDLNHISSSALKNKIKNLVEEYWTSLHERNEFFPDGQQDIPEIQFATKIDHIDLYYNIHFLTTVVMELLRNAAKYGEEIEHIHINTHDEGYLLIELKNKIRKNLIERDLHEGNDSEFETAVPEQITVRKETRQLELERESIGITTIKIGCELCDFPAPEFFIDQESFVVKVPLGKVDLLIES